MKADQDDSDGGILLLDSCDYNVLDPVCVIMALDGLTGAEDGSASRSVLLNGNDELR